MAYVEEKLNKEVSIRSSPVQDEENGKLHGSHTTDLEKDTRSSSEETAKDGEFDKEEIAGYKSTLEESDGGYGWLVVLGAFMVQITSFGVVSSWGVMQNYLHQTMFKDNSKALVDLSFVGTLALVFINGTSPIVQVCVARYGLMPVMITGTLFITLALELASLATQVWHLYLTQGVLFGAGASCMYVIVMSVTPQWFTKNRGIAMGIVAGGSGMGGLIVPFIMTPLNRSLGYAWTYRILGFICLVCDVIACVLVKEKFPRVKEKKKLSSVLHFDVLKNVNFLIFAVGSDIALFGYFVPFFFIPAYASYLGLTDSQGSALISVCSTMNFIGRLAVGYSADKIGKLNTNIVITFITALSSLLIWNFAFTYSVLMGFCVVFGFGCGGYFALMSPISAEILGMEKFPSGLSLLLLFNAFPVFGSNIASAIETGVNSPPFFTYKMFTGVTYLLGALILLYLKFRMNKNPFIKI